MAVVVNSALLAAALSLFLALISFVIVKYVRYQWRERDANSSDDSDDDDENDNTVSEMMGVDSNGEEIALINQEHRRMQRAESSATAANGAGLLQRLLTLLSFPGAVVEKKLLSKRYQRRRTRRKLAPKKFHKPYFYPLLQETAQWWEAQCELQVIKVDAAAVLSSPPLSSSIAKRMEVAPEEPKRPVQSDLLYAADANVLAAPAFLPALKNEPVEPTDSKQLKKLTRQSMARESSIPLQIGLRLDVLDNEGIWNTGTIVDVAKDDDDDLVEIKYDGWGDEYNEWVPASKQRLAPLHMFTIVKKCWAKLTKWPWWPAFVVLRAPTKRGAVEALDAETKVYVEFFDSFDEDKRSRCWMQKKSVVSFDDNFEERAAKNVGKNFHKFVEHTQRALASSSPLLFAGSGTLPIEYSSKSPLSYVVQKQKLGNKEWFAAYTSFSNRYRALYGFEVAKAGTAGGANKVNLPSIQGRAAAAGDDEDVEVAEGEDYADEDESEDKDEPEEDEASVNEDEEEVDEEEEDEAVKSARGRRSARVEQRQQPKRKLPARASTRRNAQKRVKAIEQLLQATSHVKRSQPGASTSEGKSTAATTGESAQGGTTLASSSTSTLSASAPADASHKPSTSEQAPVLHSLDDDAAEDVVATLKDATAVEASNAESESTSTEPAAPLSLVEWSVHSDSQIFVISSEVPSPVPTLARKPSAPKKTQAASPSTPSPSSATTSSFHRRKLPRKVSITSVFGHDLQQITSSVRFVTSRRSNTSANGKQPVLDSEDEDSDAFRFWTGGSREEVNHEPWKIQSWLLHGLKQKVEHAGSN